MTGSLPSISPGLKPLRSALRDDTDKPTPAAKAVQIAEPDVADVQEAPVLPPAEDAPSRKQFPVSLARRLSGRPAILAVAGPSSSRTSVTSQLSTEGVTGSSSSLLASTDDVQSSSQQQQHVPSLSQSQLSLQSQCQASLPQSPPLRAHSHHHRRRSLDHASGRLLAQLAEWVQHERVKQERRAARRVARPHGRKTRSPEAVGSGGTTDTPSPSSRSRAPSVGSASSEVSLDRLQHMIDDGMAAFGLEAAAATSASASASGSTSGACRGRRSSRSLRYPPSRTSTAGASSDTDYVDGDVFVPGCDAVLDNGKTLKYAAADTAAVAAQERQAWVGFKNEIVRLAHTLRLKGWRKVPLDAGETISVERLSGALTNAVYVVLPPADALPPPAYVRSNPGAATAAAAPLAAGSKPRKLLLRIYGPQVEHLIDRENELSVLRRLARKKIGPRLLGTFANGRFEEFFDASTLTAAQLREPDTSRQIAKRMRELHDGVELLEPELAAGPNVWRNWDRWLDTVERTIAFLDRGVAAAAAQNPPPDPRTVSGADAWQYRGFVCGVPWPRFRAAVDAYRQHVQKQAGGTRKIRDHLVFAHNDTQYGNILRVSPHDKSPLLQPANEHKQLVVIDFEYAAANPPGVEFANHFTEWAYNYHDAQMPFACDVAHYPSPEQQRRFLRAYVEHRPAFPHLSGANTPRFGPVADQPPTNASSIAEFMLDARAPPGGWKDEEHLHDAAVETQVDEFIAETRLWRPANSAQWVVWGIVQAKVPGLDPAAAEPAVEEDGFDYLAYAQDRALFFWGDCVQMGIVRLEDLPADLQTRVKMVPY